MSCNIKLNLPEFDIRCRTLSEKAEVWDPIRKKWLVLTPEEWVRQNFIRYMIDVKRVNPLFIKQELGMKLNDTPRRADIVIYDSTAVPRMVIECKAPQVKITRETLEQVARYNMVLKLPYLAVTNGLTHYCFKYAPETGSFIRQNDFPDYQTITEG